MFKNKILFIFLIVALLATSIIARNNVLASPAAATIPVNFIVDTEHARAPISPYIYGTNQDLAGYAPTLRRFGGNRTTGFNWETNASSAGSDYLHNSDDFACGWVGVTAADCATPGAVISAFHDKSLQQGAASLLTLQMAGYVAADKNGPVSAAEVAPSARWFPAVFAKGSVFANPPVTTDSAVYMDEQVNYLVQKYGLSTTANGVKMYSLDNEPALWPSTHPRIHPGIPTVNELMTKSIALSKAVKAVDPGAQIFGPAAYGFAEYAAFQDAPDWPTLQTQGNYAWFLDYYLAQMKSASDTSGKRLLDALDVHWYPEAQGGGQRIVFNGAGTVDTQKARVQAPRTLWDPTYVEDSWIATWFPTFLPLIPRLQQSINTYYPGTKLAITEFSYGGEADISGGMATADVLGIYGKYGLYAATFWQLEGTSSYVTSAYNLYRNYNGSNGKFGDTKIDTDNSDIANSSMYASITGTDTSKVNIIVINKSFDSDITGSFKIYSPVNYASGQVWGFDSASASITQRTSITGITGNAFTYTIPPRTVYHIVLTAGTTSATNTPRPPTATHTPTRTATATYTPCYGCGFKLQYQVGDVSASPNQLTPHFNIVNNSGAAVPLSEFKIRYWYTNEGNKAQTYACDYASMGCANTSGTFVKMSPSQTGADNYLEIGFTAAAGSLAAGAQSGGIQARINKSDWTNYTQTGDYSFDPTKTAYTDWDHVTLYRNNGLVWGIEPGMGPTPTAGPSNTPTRTATVTLPPAITNTPTPTATRTLTPVVTNTLTPTRTATCACITITPTRTLTPAVTNTPTRTSTITNTPAISNTSTRTSTVTLTPTRTLTPAITLTRTNTPLPPTVTPTNSVGACSPVSATITAPFTFDGAGTFCWQSSNLGSYMNNWNNASVTINGVNITNVYMGSSSYPAKIGGYWYVSYSSAVAWGHFEAK